MFDHRKVFLQRCENDLGDVPYEMDIAKHILIRVLVVVITVYLVFHSEDKPHLEELEVYLSSLLHLL